MKYRRGRSCLYEGKECVMVDDLMFGLLIIIDGVDGKTRNKAVYPDELKEFKK